MYILQKEIEDKLFNFIEENFDKKRYECYNKVVNFVEDKIIPTLINTDDINGCIEDLEIENQELEDSVAELKNAFDTLKEDCCDRLEEIESDLEDIIENNESNSVLDKLKELKEDVKNHRWIVKNADDFLRNIWRKDMIKFIIFVIIFVIYSIVVFYCGRGYGNAENFHYINNLKNENMNRR